MLSADSIHVAQPRIWKICQHSRGHICHSSLQLMALPSSVLASYCSCAAAFADWCFANQKVHLMHQRVWILIRLYIFQCDAFPSACFLCVCIKKHGRTSLYIPRQIPQSDVFIAQGTNISGVGSWKHHMQGFLTLLWQVNSAPRQVKSLMKSSE